MANSSAPNKQIQDLANDLQEFRKQYQLDMHGDTNATNGGRHGLVDLVRETREYPSITWMWAHKPVQTVSIFLVIFMATHLLYDLTPPLFTAIWALIQKLL